MDIDINIYQDIDIYQEDFIDALYYIIGAKYLERPIIPNRTKYEIEGEVRNFLYNFFQIRDWDVPEWKPKCSFQNNICFIQFELANGELIDIYQANEKIEKYKQNTYLHDKVIYNNNNDY